MTKIDEGELAVSYVRVSSLKQARKGYSIENQELLNSQAADSQGFRLSETFIDKAVSVSRGSDKQSEYKRMMEYCIENNVKRIYCFAIDRLGRTQSELHKFFEWGRDNQIQIYCTSNHQLFDLGNKNDLTSEMLLAIMAMMARFETIQREERVAFQREKAKKEGRCGPKRRKGNKPLLDKNKVINLLRLGEHSVQLIADKFDCSKRSVYNIQKEAIALGLL